LENILKTGLIKERVVGGEAAYSFADAIVRDVVHEEVSASKHGRLHHTVGCALEIVYAQKIDEHLAELAHQFLEGNDKDRAFGYFFKAGEKAEKVYAHNQASICFQYALSLVGGSRCA